MSNDHAGISKHIMEHNLHTMRLPSITVGLFLYSNIWRHNSDCVMGVPSIHVTAQDLACFCPHMIVVILLEDLTSFPESQSVI